MTFLSRAIAFAVVAPSALGLAASTARAQSAYPPSPAAPTTPAREPAAAAIAPAAARDGFDRRHQLGAQVGGTGVFQAVYRLRMVGPVHLEAGGLAADHGGNASLGLLVGAPLAGRRWFPYVGLGVGALWAFGPQTAVGCDPRTTSDCPTGDASDSLVFAHLRAGFGVALGATRRHLLSLDVGGWRGAWAKARTDVTGTTTQTSGRTTMPMAGLSYLFAL